MSIPVSVLILTKNEQSDIGDCLRSVAWSDDVHVLDSFSEDDTVSIATRLGAKVHQRVFDGYASQRNFGLSLPFKYSWLLILDADERIPQACATSIERATQHLRSDIAALRLRRRDIWWGRWLKHAQISPYFIRLIRIGKAHYEREINEVLVVDGPVGDLDEPFDHYPFSKGLDHWISKHNRYSGMEAELIAAGHGVAPSLRSALFHPDFNERRRYQKALFYRLPGRPFIKFFYMMAVRCAFLDGWPGIRYAILQSIYEYFIVLKTKEILNQSKTSLRTR